MMWPREYNGHITNQTPTANRWLWLHTLNCCAVKGGSPSGLLTDLIGGGGMVQKETQSQRWRRLNPKRALEISRKANKKFRSIHGDWWKNHPAKAKRSSRKSMRKSRLKTYGFTPQTLKNKRKEQKGKCAIPSCGATKLLPDHDHGTGKPRGLLCKKHNAGLGFFGDNISGIKEALTYLEQYENKETP